MTWITNKINNLFLKFYNQEEEYLKLVRIFKKYYNKQ